LAQVYVVEIEAVGVGVQFHRDFMFRRSGEDRIHVEVVSVAAKLQAAGGMADDGGVGVRTAFSRRSVIFAGS
jgi:hypothetical protein